MNRTCHNTYITRPYALFADNHTQAPLKRFRQLQRIWEGRKVIFVVGNQSRLGVENDLLTMLPVYVELKGSTTRLTPGTMRYWNARLRLCRKIPLFLVALGPTAGMLVYDLFKNGYQAVDIGHGSGTMNGI